MIDNCSSSNFAFIFWTISINIDCRKFALLYFGQFLFKYQRVCFSIFLNSDKEITTSGLNKFPWWGIIKRIYISKERLESTTCFYSKSGWFYTFFFCFCHTDSHKVDERRNYTLVNQYLSQISISCYFFLIFFMQWIAHKDV